MAWSIIKAVFGFVALLMIPLYWHTIASPGAFSRPFNDSKLGVFEFRIAGLTDELVRRSPGIQKNLAAYAECSKTPGCDLTALRKRRDLLVAATWPSMVDRLSITKDWGAYTRSAIERDQFFDVLKKFGRDTVRMCVPVVEYAGNDLYLKENLCSRLGGAKTSSHRYSLSPKPRYFFFFNLSGR